MECLIIGNCQFVLLMQIFHYTISSFNLPHVQLINRGTNSYLLHTKTYWDQLFMYRHVLSSTVVGSACVSGDVRLVNGMNEYEGRPEVCIGGKWGTICADFRWDDKDAQAICRQIGYSNPSSKYTHR